jgi:hypothetical protein
VTGEQASWWRTEYDRSVSAYRIDDPVIEVAAARLSAGWHPDSDGKHPWDWSVTALAEELHQVGGWSSVRRLLSLQGCSAEMLALFEADATEYDGPWRLEPDAARIPGDVTLVTAMTRWLINEEYSSSMLDDVWDDAAFEHAITSAVAAGGEMAQLAERVVSGELDRANWALEELDARSATTAHSWVGGVAAELASPLEVLDVPSAPAILDVWSRSLDALPTYGSAPWVVGAVMEDLFDVRRGAWWAWGPELVAARVEIIDSVLGTGANVSTALSGCWVSAEVDVFDQWAQLIRRRGLQARGVTDDERSR